MRLPSSSSALFRSVSTKALIVLTLASKRSIRKSLKINTFCSYLLNMKSVMKLNRLWLKFLLLCKVDVQESSREGNVNFKSKALGVPIFRLSESPKYKISGNHGATSEIYWDYYKPPNLSHSEVGTYLLSQIIPRKLNFA